MKLGHKIALGFGSLIAIAMGLGAVAYYGALAGNRSVLELSTETLPAVQSLQTIKLCGEQIKNAQRTLLNQGLDEAIATRQYDLVARARENYTEAFKVFESIPMTPEEDRFWKEFVGVWQQWKQDNTEFFRLAKEYRALIGGNINALNADLMRFRGDHYAREMEVLEAITDRKIPQHDIPR